MANSSNRYCYGQIEIYFVFKNPGTLWYTKILKEKIVEKVLASQMEENINSFTLSSLLMIKLIILICLPLTYLIHICLKMYCLLNITFNKFCINPYHPAWAPAAFTKGMVGRTGGSDWDWKSVKSSPLLTAVAMAGYRVFPDFSTPVTFFSPLCSVALVVSFGAAVNALVCIVALLPVCFPAIPLFASAFGRCLAGKLAGQILWQINASPAICTRSRDWLCF